MYSSCVHAEKLTDEDLMMRLRKGDESALALLVERYQNDLFRFCLYYVREIEQAKEMAQETFLRVFVARDRFDTSRRFRPWVLCIARNLCLNELKRRKTVSMESLESYASAARDALSGVLSQSAEDMPDAQALAEAVEVEADYFVSLDQKHLAGNPRTGRLSFAVGTPGEFLEWCRQHVMQGEAVQPGKSDN